jgi:hypothetical protein
MGRNVNTIKKNTEALLDPPLEFGLEVNVAKTKYSLTTPNQNADKTTA